MQFLYEALPMRVAFGQDYRQHLVQEARHLELKRVLVLSTEGREHLAHEVAEALGEASAGVYAKARMHVPVETAHDAARFAVAVGADGCVAVGGGSAIGLGKAIALEFGTPIIALPTTYSGSEMTPVWGMTADGVKKTGRDRRVLPRSVIYDPALTTSLPVATSVTSGFNALAHAVEALYAPDRTPIISLMAEEGARALTQALPQVGAHPLDLGHRAGALYGAWLCGVALGATTMSLHHQLCHVLGGSFGLPHAETHTVLLPYVLAYNAPGAPAALAALRRATGAGEPATFLRDLAVRLGAPPSLAALGFSASDVAHAVDLALKKPYANPRPVTADGVSAILSAAVNGDTPNAPTDRLAEKESRPT